MTTTARPHRVIRRRSHDERARARERIVRRATERRGHARGPARAVEVARENPVTVVATLVAFLVAVGEWGISLLPDAIPVAVVTPLHGLVLAVAAAVGKWAQRFTYDRVGMDESIANFVDDIHRIAGTETPPPGPDGYIPE